MRKLEYYFVVFCALFGWALGGASTAFVSSPKHHVQSECSFTRYPGLCVQTLIGLGSSGFRSTDVVSALVEKTISETKLPSTTSDFSLLSSHLGVQAAQRAHYLTDYCETLMGMSMKKLNQSLTALKKFPRKKKEDIQTWLSASLTFVQACKDSAASYHGVGNGSSVVSGGFTSKISKKMDYLSELSSNALALANRIKRNTKIINSNETTRRLAEDFPKWVSPKERKLLQAPTIEANAIVAQDGTGNYKSVSEAIKAASGGRFVIYVKSGVYKEKIHTNKDGITLIGDGKYSTIIVGDDSVANGASMPGSATVTITGDGFIARDIGFHNTAGPKGKQALALNIASDRSALYRCSIAGYQDTLYTLALRQFYRECDIYGTIDFIFGNSIAVFQNCNVMLRRPLGGSENAILANGRSDPGQNTGFSLQNCRIGPGSDFAPVKHSYESYLGRPWKEYSRAVVMQSTIDDAIKPSGWVEWPGNGKSVLSSLYFAEFANVGPGAGISGRVKWPGFKVIGANEASKFTVANFIDGTSWLPSTRVAFDSGL
ncbi:hypothetical protein UlMin_021877 [Ulmus minor]